MKEKQKEFPEIPEKEKGLDENEVLTREESKSGLISRKTIESAKKWIDQQPIEVLKKILVNNEWVIGHGDDKTEIESASDQKIRELMKNELYEDYAYVEEALKNVGIPVRYEKD